MKRDEVRKKIVDIISKDTSAMYLVEINNAVSAILAIPEIAEALKEKPFPISACCNASVRTETGDDKYICEKCERICDLAEWNKPKEEKFDPQSMDAVVWAKEFMRIYLSFRNAEGRLFYIDEELMRGWFANAIMAGYDEVRRKYEKLISEPIGEISPLFNVTEIGCIYILRNKLNELIRRLNK
jgi:hypothetical protein